MDTIDIIARIVLGLFILKSLFIGSQFNIILWLKHGREYYEWYHETIIKPEFKPK